MAEKFIFEPWDISKLQSSYDVVIVGSGSTGLTAAILYGKKVPVSVFADLFDITDEKWKNSVVILIVLLQE